MSSEKVKNMKHILLLMVLLSLSLSCQSQPTRVEATSTVPAVETTPSAPDSQYVFSPQQLEQDLLILRTTLEEAHPGLYDYVDQDTRDAQFDALLQQLEREMTDIEFYRLVALLIADIHDGHTAAWPSARSMVYNAYPAGFLPFTLRLIENRAFIENSYATDVDITPRTEVLAIDGLAMPDVVERLLPYISRDGYSETAPSFLLGQMFPLYYAYFIGPSDTYAVTVRDPGTDEERTVEIPSLSPIKLGAILTDPSDPGENLNLEVLEEQAIAILTIRSFDDSAIPTFFADAFAQLDELGIQDLIIDLRGNGGGNGRHGALLGCSKQKGVDAHPICNGSVALNPYICPLTTCPLFQHWG